MRGRAIQRNTPAVTPTSDRVSWSESFVGLGCETASGAADGMASGTGLALGGDGLGWGCGRLDGGDILRAVLAVRIGLKN